MKDKLISLMAVSLLISSCSNYAVHSSRNPSSNGSECVDKFGYQVCIGDPATHHYDSEHRVTGFKNIDGELRVVTDDGEDYQDTVVLLDDRFSITLPDGTIVQRGHEYENFIGGVDKVIGFNPLKGKTLFKIATYKDGKFISAQWANEEDLLLRSDKNARVSPSEDIEVQSFADLYGFKAPSQKEFKQFVIDNRDKLEVLYKTRTYGDDNCKKRISNTYGINSKVISDKIDVDYESCFLSSYSKGSTSINPDFILGKGVTTKYPSWLRIQCKVLVKHHCEYSLRSY